MTEYEILQKIERIKLSEAPIGMIKSAITALEKKLPSTTLIAAHKQIVDSQPDYSDIGT